MNHKQAKLFGPVTTALKLCCLKVSAFLVWPATLLRQARSCFLSMQYSCFPPRVPFNAGLLSSVRLKAQRKQASFVGMASFLLLSLGLIGPVSGQIVAAGGTYTAVIRADSTLWSWGNLTYDPGWESPPDRKTGPAPQGHTVRWQSVAVGEHHALAVRRDGTLWAWGSNARGQVCLGGTARVSSPVQIKSASTWRQVAGGYSHSLAIRTDGTLWGWGYNRAVQTRDVKAANQARSAAGSKTASLPAPMPLGPPGASWRSVAAGERYTLALRSDGTLWAWGQIEDRSVETWADPQQAASIPWRGPIQIGTSTSWQSIAVGYDYALALQQDGTLWAWGNNEHGQLGRGDQSYAPNPVQISPGVRWQCLAAGRSHTLAVRRDGTLWAWGHNDEGQLGDGTTSTRLSPVQIGTDSAWRSVAAGRFHSVAVKRDGTVWTWGNNDAGQLGNSAESTRSPQLVSALR
ncbi:hypothetical protein ASU33_19625 [Solirubrum puertoriconensis]|uniref:RCC1-like domain-containing protein n=1 Tax=Solirubrum puertoriconensis TaxID=1751427 RepID=A0A9X0L5V3_SOLP1|nr:hypothetical protein ASU33_19625 [Solirubrum puertoriconensis]